MVNPPATPADHERSGGFEMRVVMTAERASVAFARRLSGEACRAAGIGAAATDDVRLAVTEACANAVLHGYGGGRADEVVELSIISRGQRLEVSVLDHGAGLLPGSRNAGLGLGYPLMTSLASDVEIRAGDHGTGTEVRMGFPIPGPRIAHRPGGRSC